MTLSRIHKSNVHSSVWFSLLGCSAIAIGIALQAQIAQSASSSAYGESVNVTVTPLVGVVATVTSGPLPTASGTAPSPYNVTNNVAGVNVSASATPNSGLLQTGLLTATATGNLPGSNTTTATATVNNLNLDAVAFAALLGIDATTVQSNVQIQGTCGASLTATATTLIEGGQATGSLIVGGTVAINAFPPPNFVLLNVAGIRVVLNEQSIGGDGVNNRSATVNAIHVYFTNAPIPTLGVLNGDIVISHSEAQLQCPATSAGADVAITKSDSPDPVTVGANLTYTLTATNSGPGTATGVVISDTLPSSVTFISASAGCSHASGVVTCQPVTLSPGASTSVTIVVRPNAAGSIINTATVTTTSTDPNPANNTATATTTVAAAPPPGTGANLAVTKSDSPDPVSVGANLTYTVTVTNNGPDTAAGVVLTDTLPSSATFISSSPPGCSHSAGVVTCQPVSLAAGASVSVTIVVRPNSAGIITNTATVSSTTPDPDPGNNTATVTTSVVAAPPPPPPGTGADVTVTITDNPDPVSVGANLTYTVTVANNGPDTAAGVVLTVTLPTSVTFVSSSPLGCSHSAGVLTCQPVSLAAGASVSVTIVVRPNSAGAITITASVSSTTPDADPGNNAATEPTMVIAAVPTMNEIGLLALAVLLTVIGFWSLRRRGGTAGA